MIDRKSNGNVLPGYQLPAAAVRARLPSFQHQINSNVKLSGFFKKYEKKEFFKSEVRFTESCTLYLRPT